MGDAYKAVEPRLLAAIHLRFGLPATTPGGPEAQIKEADRSPPSSKRRELAGFAREEALNFFGRPQALPAEILAWLDPLDTETAQARFRALRRTRQRAQCVRRTALISLAIVLKTGSSCEALGTS